MNFLAHLYLAKPNTGSIIGSLGADFLKGQKEAEFSEDMRDGFRLHHKVDAFADAHPMHRASARRLTPTCERYARVAVDVIYDHLLATHWSTYSDQPLEEFIDEKYAILQSHRHLCPKILQSVLPYMVRENWLLSYRELSGIRLAMKRVSRRLSRGVDIEKSVDELAANKPAYEAEFLAFFPDLVEHVAAE